MRTCRSDHLGLLLVSAVVAVACAGEEVEQQCEGGDRTREQHGTDCLCCHEEYGAAGSVEIGGPPVRRISLTDATGYEVIVTPNPYGNFFVRMPLTAPLAVAVEGMDGQVFRKEAVEHGSCNRCHTGGEVRRVYGSP